MAKAKGASRSRISARPSRSGRPGKGPSASSFATVALRQVTPVGAFLQSPPGLALVIAVIVALALPWLSILDVIEAIRRSVLQATGAGSYLLASDLVALIAVPSLFAAARHSRTFWRVTAGCQLLLYAFWAGLGLLHPSASLVGVSLAVYSAGGDVGRALTAGPLMTLLWLVAVAGGASLVSPSASRFAFSGVSRSVVEGYRSWQAHRARVEDARLVGKEIPTEIQAGAALLEPPPPLETIGEAAAGAFRRSNERKAAKPAPAASVAEPAVDASETPPTNPTPPSDRGWQLPGSAMLAASPPAAPLAGDNEARARTIVETLASFGVDARVVQINQGPTVTQFGVEPGWEIKTRAEPERDADGRVLRDKDGRAKLRFEEVSRTRVRVNQVTKLQNDIALALAAPSLRIEAPVPGKSVIGIEVPNTSSAVVSLRSVVESQQFVRAGARSKLAMALGMGVSGEPIVADLARMPHLLIAGSTGSGKSVCINAIIACILMHATPDEVRLVLIDPKRVEMAAFEVIPHLALSKIITDMEDVPGTLQGVIREMDARYKKFEKLKVRNLEGYNKHPKVAGKLPQWVVIIDELADLMMAVPFEVERQICRLAQLARATGIHLVVATQRPSVDVITGLIKANFPTRIAFAVSSQVDSRTILDSVGAEKLLGRGDMLYMASDEPKPRRLQGVYVSDQEIERLVDFWGAERWEKLRPETFDHLVEEAKAEQAAAAEPEGDELLEKARALAVEHKRISASMLQRRLRIGYPRAARLMDSLEDEGLIAPGDGSSSREVLGSDEDSIFGDL